MKSISRFLGALVLLGTLSGLSSAAGVTDFVDYCSGPNNTNCPYKVDGSGNVTTAANSTVAGKAIFPSQLITAVSTNTTIVPTATYVNVISSGTGAVTLGAGTLVAIATASATNGQYLILGSTTGVNYVQITTGTIAGVVGPTAVISTLNKVAAFIFDSSASVWKQVQQ